MMSASSKGSILYKLLIVVLAVLVMAILIIPPGLWQEENRQIRAEQRNMLATYAAEKFFHQQTGRFSLDYDTLSAVIAQDSSLENRRQVAVATQQIYATLQDLLKNDMVMNLLLIGSSYYSMLEDFDDPENQILLRSAPEGRDAEAEALRLTAEKIEAKLRALPNNPGSGNVVAAASAALALEDLAKNIGDQQLGNALLETYNRSDSLKRILQTFSPEAAETFFESETKALVNQFVAEFDAIHVSNFSSRMLSFHTQILFGLTNIRSAGFTSLREEYNNRSDLVEGNYRSLITEYSRLQDRYATLYISERDSLLTEFSPASVQSVLAPGEQLAVEFDTSHAKLAVESPFLFPAAKEIAAPVLEQAAALSIGKRFLAIHRELEKLQPVIDHNLEEIRNKVNYRVDRNALREVQLELKTLPAVLRNFKAKPGMVKGDEFIDALARLNHEKRFSQMESGVKDMINLGAYFATVVDSQKVKDIANLMQSLSFDANKTDSIFADTRLRRSRLDWLSLGEVVAAAKAELQALANEMPGEVTKYRALSNAAREAYQELEEGQTVYRFGIFPVKQHNPGFVDSEEPSWLKQEE
jgi:Tfp pilus assembly protein PilE